MHRPSASRLKSAAWTTPRADLSLASQNLVGALWENWLSRPCRKSCARPVKRRQLAGRMTQSGSAPNGACAPAPACWQRSMARSNATICAEAWRNSGSTCRQPRASFRGLSFDGWRHKVIGSSGDILAEVAAAADPVRSQAARRRLESLADSAQPGFSGLVAAQGPRIQSAPPAAYPAPQTGFSNPLAAKGNGQSANPYRSLGALLLQKAFETMIPATQAQGASRSASAVWASMLARQLADASAERVFPAQSGGSSAVPAPRSSRAS